MLVSFNVHLSVVEVRHCFGYIAIGIERYSELIVVVRNVAFELVEGHGSGALKLKARRLRSGGDVTDEKVLGIGNPKRRRSAIARTDAQSLFLGLRPQIVLENIVGLNSVLCDETVPERIVRHVVLNEDGVGSVDDDASLEGVSDDVVFHDASCRNRIC